MQISIKEWQCKQGAAKTQRKSHRRYANAAESRCVAKSGERISPPGVYQCISFLINSLIKAFRDKPFSLA